MLGFALAALCIALVSGAGPGVAVAFSPALVEAVYAVVEPMARKVILNTPIPDQTITTAGVEVDIANTKITAFECAAPPCFTAIFDTPTMVGRITNYTVSLQADLTITYGISFQTTMYATLANCDGAVDLNPSAEDGHLQLMSMSAAFNVQQVSVDFSGGTGWILDLVRSSIESAIRDAVQKEVPPILENLVNVKGNALLRSTPPDISIPKPSDALLNVSILLDGQPYVVDTSCTLYVSGDSTPGEECPITVPLPTLPPNPLPTLDGSDELQVAVTQNAVRSAVYSACACNSLYFRFDGNEIPGVTVMNTTWMSYMAPGLSSYPNKWMSLVVAPSLELAVPQVTILSSGVTTMLGMAFRFVVDNATTSGAGGDGDAVDSLGDAYRVRNVATSSKADAHSALEKGLGGKALLKGLDSQVLGRKLEHAAGTAASQGVAAPVVPPSTGVRKSLPGARAGDFDAFTLGCYFVLSGFINPTVVNSSVIVRGNVTSFMCPLMLVSSAVGTIYVDPVKVLLNSLIADVVMPALTRQLTSGIAFEIPKQLRFAKLKQTSVKYYAASLEVGLSVEIPPPPSS